MVREIASGLVAFRGEKREVDHETVVVSPSSGGSRRRRDGGQEGRRRKEWIRRCSINIEIWGVEEASNILS
jgi:hypothetical protein